MASREIGAAPDIGGPSVGEAGFGEVFCNQRLYGSRHTWEFACEVLVTRKS